MHDLIRYSLITDKLPREFLLLQGKGCVWKKCTFCDYYNDVSPRALEINRTVIEQVTGETGILDIINSGSAMELDKHTLLLIAQKIEECHIHTLWVEAHWLFRNKLTDFANKFPNTKVKFRIGAETFDPELRDRWCKGIPFDIGAKEIAQYFQGACLLIGVEGQTKEIIQHDIELALQYFEYFSINAFVENTTSLKRDDTLVAWFVKQIMPQIKDNPKVEILLNNTDLGVGATIDL